MPATYKARKKRKQKKMLPGYLWLLAGLTIGLFVAFIVYLDKQPASGTSFKTAVSAELNKLKSAKKPHSQQHKVDRKAENTAKKPPKYTFYTLLRGMEVLIPESETQPPKIKNKKTSAPTPTGKKYILQIGSFQNLSDAEKLKAKLAFFGLQANIQHVMVNNHPWHRVRTGPYPNTRQLYRNQKILRQHNINAISMELK